MLYPCIRHIKFLFCLLICFSAVSVTPAETIAPYSPLIAPRKHEIRAVWLATIKGLDWPRTLATSPSQISRQKQELVEILDCLQAANVNVVLFQTRVRGNLFYPSSIETWCESLTGEGGKSPGYDPLAFAIEECHKRGMELHAWMVTIPLGSDKVQKELGKSSIVKRNPHICKRFNGNWYLNPGHPETSQYLSRLVRDLLNRYDVDGVHLDYIRYPDRPRRFPDWNEFRKYGKGKTLQQWRRDNITEIVRTLYKEVKSLKPWVKVSSAPLGKYRDTQRYPSYGWNAYHTVFQEAQLWMREGIQDMIFPMLYYRDLHFYPFVLDWVENASGRWVVPGLGIYFLHPSEGDWTLDEVERQLNFIRLNGADGEACYRARFLTENNQGLLERMKEAYYPTRALLPPMTWIDSLAPTSPQKEKMIMDNHCIRLAWSGVTDEGAGGVFYNVYKSKNYPVNTDSPENLLSARLRDTIYVDSLSSPSDTLFYYAVTAMDRCGNESLPMEMNRPEEQQQVKSPSKRYVWDGKRLTITSHISSTVGEEFFPKRLELIDEIVTIPSEFNGSKLRLTDLSGREVAVLNFARRLRMRNLPQGCYRIQLLDMEVKRWSDIGTVIK